MLDMSSRRTHIADPAAQAAVSLCASLLAALSIVIVFAALFSALAIGGQAGMVIGALMGASGMLLIKACSIVAKSHSRSKSLQRAATQRALRSIRIVFRAVRFERIEIVLKSIEQNMLLAIDASRDCALESIDLSLRK